MSTSTRSKKFENHPVRIVAASFFILLLELALIRFIPSEIKAISYFTNLLVFAAFFGLGLGCILWRKNLPAWLLPTGLMLLAGFVFFSRGITVYETDGAVHYWLQGQDTRFRPFLQIPLWATAISAFAFSAIPFVTMGWRLAREMQLHPRLPGYGYDLLGSLAGTLFFAAASWLGCPPWVLILVTACAWGLIFHADSATRLLHLFPGLVFLFSLIAPYSWKWSPYYFIQYNVDARAITIWVNSSFHQEAVNFSITEPPHKDNAQVIKEKFGLPYKIYAEHHQGRYPKKVLILGAGSGNDVNIALMQGAEHVTAVEIDPTIVDIGRKHNPRTRESG